MTVENVVPFPRVAEEETLDTRAVAVVVSEAVTLKDDDLTTFLESFVSALTPEQVLNVGARAKEGASVFSQLIRMIELRMVVDHPQGVTWTDPITGKQFDFSDRSYRKCEDVVGLWDEMRKRGVGIDSFLRAVSARGLRISDLRQSLGYSNASEKKEVEALLSEFLVWKSGPKRIRVLDEEDGDTNR